MILAATLTPSAILVIAMGVVLLLIVGVVAAMRQPALKAGKPVKRVPAPIPLDVSHIDLEERLRVIVLPPKQTLATVPQTANFQTRSLDRTVGARAPTAPIMIQPPRPDEISTLLGPRSALPGPVSAPRTPSPSRPTTAPLSGLPALPSSSSQPAVVIMPPSALPPAASATHQPLGAIRQPSVQARKVPKVEMAPEAEPRVTPRDVDLPGTRGFTMISDEIETYDRSAQSPLVDAPARKKATGPLDALPGPAEALSPEWPASGTRQPHQTGYGATSESTHDFDLRTNGTESSRPFTMAPTMADDDAMPLGAVLFAPDLLKLKIPASTQLGADALANALGIALYDDAQPSGVPSLNRANSVHAPFHAGPSAPPPLDREDNTLSETHVFATSDLYPTQIEEVEASIEQMPLRQELPLSAPPWPAAPPPAAPPAVKEGATPPGSTRPGRLEPEQEAQARQLLQEVASLPDIEFVKLLGSDGTVIVSAAKGTADSAIDEHIAVLIGFAIMEVGQLGLGEWASMAVEAPGMALLLSPLSGGASLAILLSNPARLGLLRRQLRKPIMGLQEVLSGARVS